MQTANRRIPANGLITIIVGRFESCGVRPQLVEKLIDEYISDAEAHINDPFCGCGTTIVTAISRGFKASGTDINRIAYLITRVKSTPIEPGYLDEKIDELLSIHTSEHKRALPA